MSPRRLLQLRAGPVGLVLQDPSRNLLPYATVAENVWFAQRGAHRLRRRVPFEPFELLEMLDMSGLAQRPVTTLAAGEQQAAAIACGLACGPGLLLLDEPTSYLDTAAREAVLRLLRGIVEQTGTTVLMVTHDATVAAHSSRTLTIRDGRIGVEGRPGREYAVVAKDGSVSLPPSVRETLPPGTRVWVRAHPDGADVRRVDDSGAPP
ncbi:MAG: ATP-binding cassette domain-containing protein [Mycobacteriales bacterium]